MPKVRPLSSTKFIDDANLVSYWKLDESSGNATDSKGSNTLTNVNTATYSAAVFGNGLNADSAGQKYLSIADATQTGLDFTTAFTISGWYKKATTKRANISKSNTGTPSRGYNLEWATDDKIYLAVSGNGSTDNYFASTSTFTNTDFIHVVGVFNGSTFVVYVNGAVVAGSVTGSVPASANNSTASFRIGGIETAYNDASFDDVSVFSRALSSSEVNEIYQGGTLGEYLGAGSGTTKLLLHLNGNSTDSSGNSKNGTDTNVTYVNGLLGQCASFAGNGKSVLPAILTSTASAFTVSYWTKPGNTTASYVIAPDTTGLYAARSVSGTFYFDVYTNTYILECTTAVDTSKWHNYIYTWSTSQQNAKLYMDGNLVSTSADAVTSAIDLSQALAVGTYPSATSAYYTGLVDEVIIENRAWSASEIKKYYTYAKGRFGIN